MCGVAGFSLSPTERVNVKKLTKSLLLSIEHRGKDATGFAFADKTGLIQVHKYDTDATHFVKNRLCVPRNARTVICHTRFATQGLPIIMENNHPIATGPIVGVHNGMLWNDDTLFRRIENEVGYDVQIAQVDSEAAFAALGYMNKPVLEILPEIKGSAALAWLDGRDERDTLHLARVESSPLIIGETSGGSVIFASTEAAVIAACRDTGLSLTMLRDIQEGTYITVTDGEYDDVRTFEVPKWVSYSSYTGKSKYSPARRGVTAAQQQELDDYEWYGSVSGVRNTRVTPMLALGSGGSATGDKLRERLAAEVPEIIDTTGWTEDDLRVWHLDQQVYDGEVMFTAEGDYAMDDDDPDGMTYEEWWARNQEACDEAVARDNELERRRRRNDDDKASNHRKEFAEYLAAPVLSAFYITHPRVGLAAPTSESAYLADDRHVDREADVERYAAGIKGDENAKTRALSILKANARPADYIKTEVNGTLCRGQIACLPDTFPHGEYILRVFMPHEKRDNSYEVAYIGRLCHEWEFDYAAFTPRDDQPDNVVHMRPKENA